MEARKKHLEQMSGIAVGMLLQPSRGVRDDLIRIGGIPKDHMKENRKALRAQEKENKLKKEILAKPAPEPFKLKAFQKVPSKVKIASASSTPKRIPTPTKNYIYINAMRAKSAPTSRATSVASSPKPEQKPGQLPRYLIERKLQWAKKEQDRLIQLQKEKVPKGQTLLPDQDRMTTLNALRSKRDKLVKDIQMLPLVIELQSLKKRKADMETLLRETDSGIDLFSRSKVYVPTSEFELMMLNKAA